MKQLAIIGPTASGKSDLAIKIAQKMNAYILSIDSLSIYKEIDIVSAKPSREELAAIKHFGIDVLYPDEYFSVEIFIKLYKDVVALCKKEKKNLIIVGGTSFYLKSLMQGLSKIPPMTPELKQSVAVKMKNLEEVFQMLQSRDPLYMKKINPKDSYRIEKALLILEASQMTPSKWFMKNPPEPIIEKMPIYNIDVSRDVLRNRIQKRTKKMLTMGLIDEVAYLEKKYSREPNAMSSIGVVEVLSYLDAEIELPQMLELISIHTAQLAKRQQTFNRTQFTEITTAPLEELEEIILSQ